MSESISVSASPVTDHYEFLIALWEGLFDRKPKGVEINSYLAALNDSSMTRQQVVSDLRNREEFINGRDILLAYKVIEGNWNKLGIILNEYESFIGSASNEPGQNPDALNGLPFTPIGDELGFYEGINDDHGNLISSATIIEMNEPEILSILAPAQDIDVFKIKSLNLQTKEFYG